ncbi:hypothetical protein ACFWGC_29525 [Cytobacillus pseudoceanisediminis]|uniref:hypothetical protein n=1 Tax=Cytobacillus pseudoceanisediminis TaxID=3051614 RepID=UPI00364A967F
MEALRKAIEHLNAAVERDDPELFHYYSNRLFPSLGKKVIENLSRHQRDIACHYLNHFNELSVIPHLLSSDLISLPKKRSSELDYYDFLKKLFGDFQTLIKEYDDTFTMHLNVNDEIKIICNSILDAVKTYYGGHPSIAFNKLDEGLAQIRNHLGFFMENKTGIPPYLFRMRNSNGKNHELKNGEMYHIPFEKRHLISTQRYSIPGLPCLYLGSSAYVCWEELERPLLENTQTSIFSVAQSYVKLLDFGLRPIDMYESHMDSVCTRIDPTLSQEEVKEIQSFLITWPLMAACSIQVVFRDSPFKPEYIVPQLILQWVMNNPEYDGIRYFSVKESCQKNSFHLIENYVFPAKNHESKGHCKALKQILPNSEGLPWQLFKIQPRNYPPFNQGNMYMSLSNDVTIQYEKTDFGELESFLVEKSKVQGNFIYKASLEPGIDISNETSFFKENKEIIEELLSKILVRWKEGITSIEPEIDEQVLYIKFGYKYNPSGYYNRKYVFYALNEFHSQLKSRLNLDPECPIIKWEWMLKEKQNNI